MNVPNTQDNYDRCICYSGRCPTYNENNLDGGLFCARGKHPKNPEKKHCLCNDCPVWEQYELGNLYYCAEGSAEERGGT